MKVKKLIKLFAGTILVSAGITSVVLFSNVNTVKFPTVRILTSDTYNKIRESQKQFKRSVSIDYLSLPGTSFSVIDMLNGGEIRGNGNFMFFFGSDSNDSAARALYGWEAGVPVNTTGAVPPKASTSLMLALYDLFMKEENHHYLESIKIQDVNPTFLNYVDVSWNAETNKAQELLNYRAHSMGKPPIGIGTDELSNYSNVWQISKDVAKPNYVPVVKTNGDSPTYFNYKPDSSYYEFRPNAEEDTEYEKVYYRNQKVVKDYRSMYNILEKFGSSQQGLTFNSDATLLLVRKKSSSEWEYKTITDFSGEVNDLVKNVVTFYGAEIDENNDSSSGSGGSGDSNNGDNGSTGGGSGGTENGGSGDGETTTPPPSNNPSTPPSSRYVDKGRTVTVRRNPFKLKTNKLAKHQPIILSERKR